MNDDNAFLRLIMKSTSGLTAERKYIYTLISLVSQQCSNKY